MTDERPLTRSFRETVAERARHDPAFRDALIEEETTMPEIAEWLVAYADWLPSAIAEGHTQANDAFRAGFLAGIAWRHGDHTDD